VTNDQIFREMQEADKTRAAMDKRSEENVSKSMRDVQDGPSWYSKADEAVKDFANWGKEIGEMVKEGPAGQAFDAAQKAMADVNRRVFEEPWYGKPVADILMDRQQNPLGRDRNVDQDQGTVHGPAQEQGTIYGQDQQEQTTIHGKNDQEKDNFWEQYLGQQQAAEREQQQDQGR
jgi:hypothetical protein